jgi:hypothetical protein
MRISNDRGRLFKGGQRSKSMTDSIPTFAYAPAGVRAPASAAAEKRDELAPFYRAYSRPR